MKVSKLFAGLFGLVGVALMAAVIMIAFHFRTSNPVLIGTAKGPTETAQNLMDAVCRGDYTTASSLILGSPDFGVYSAPEDPVEKMVWQAFKNSFSYSILSEPYATDSGVAVEVCLRYLTLDSVTKDLRVRSQAIMEQRIAETDNMEEIYDENYEFLESFVMTALYDATVQALDEDAMYHSVKFTLNLVWEQDRWVVVQDSDLLYAITGGIVK